MVDLESSFLFEYGLKNWVCLLVFFDVKKDNVNELLFDQKTYSGLAIDIDLSKYMDTNKNFNTKLKSLYMKNRTKLFPQNTYLQ